MTLNPADHIDTIVREIVELGKAMAPHETGGIIIPTPTTRPAEWVTQLENLSDSPEDSCVMDIRSLPRQKLHDLASIWDPATAWLWHTHPGGHVGPSPQDMAARKDGVNYLVVTIPDGIPARY